MSWFSRRPRPVLFSGVVTRLDLPITHRVSDTSGRNAQLGGMLGVPLQAGTRKVSEPGWAQVQVIDGGSLLSPDDVIEAVLMYPLPRGPKGHLRVGDLVQLSSIPTNVGTPYEFMVVQRLTE